MTSNKVTYLLNAMAMMIVLVTPQMGGGVSGGFSGGFSGGPLIYGSGLQSGSVDGTKYNRHQTSTGDWIALGVFGLIGLIMIGLIGFLISIMIIQSTCCRCFREKLAFRRIENTYAEMVYTAGSEADFQQQIVNFEDIFQKVISGNRQFHYQQLLNERNVTINSFDCQRKKPFVCEINTQGSDFIGSWQSRGQLLMTERGPFFWMLKYYDDRVQAGQIGEWQTLVYKTTEINDTIKGKWFYQYFENSFRYSGLWKIN